MRENPALSLVIGGARSGKSACAERLVTALDPPWYYIATAEALDEEMRARIAAHAARRGPSWRTVEAPLDLAGALEALPEGAPALIDCLTLWLSNAMLAERDVDAECGRLLDALRARQAPCIAVTNEVGLGIVPDNALARRFRDLSGRMNQEVAAAAGRVFWVVAGIPVQVK